MVKNSPVNAGDAGDVGSIPGSGRSPGEGNSKPLQYWSGESTGESHGQRSLAGDSPRGCKKLNMTERLSACACARTHTHTDSLPPMSALECGFSTWKS